MHGDAVGFLSYNQSKLLLLLLSALPDASDHGLLIWIRRKHFPRVTINRWKFMNKIDFVLHVSGTKLIEFLMKTLKIKK